MELVPEFALGAKTREGVLGNRTRGKRHTTGEVAQARESPVLHQGGYHSVGERRDGQHAGRHKHRAAVLMALLGNVEKVVPGDVSLHQRHRDAERKKFDMRIFARVDPNMDFPIHLSQHVAEEKGLHGRKSRRWGAFRHKPEGVRAGLSPGESEMHRKGLEVPCQLPTSDAASARVVDTGRPHSGRFNARVKVKVVSNHSEFKLGGCIPVQSPQRSERGNVQ